MLIYTAPYYAEFLKKNLLATFEQVWAYKGEWFEPPNRERGGWSGVNFITLQDDAGADWQVYLKRQEGFMRKTTRHPFSGEPTFLREYKVIQHLQSHGVCTPKTIFFATQQQQAILMTQALTDFVDWQAWRNANPEATNARKKIVMAAIAKTVKKMHGARVQHRSLYAKHLFIHEQGEAVDVAIIDFEKSRISPWTAFTKLSDLITLNYRTDGLSRTQRLYFFKQYLGVARLNKWQKRICVYLHQQSLKKLSYKK